MLIRSKMADLKVKIDTYKGFPIAQSILAHVPRIQDLDLEGAPSHLEDLFRSLPKTAPRLQSLKVKNKDTRSTCKLPKELFSQADRLKSIDILGCDIDWAHHLTGKNSLTVLRLKDVPNTSSLSAAQFLETFAQMGSLEILDLRNALPVIEAPHAVQSRPRACLPYLQELYLSCPPEQIVFFLKHVDIPPEIILDITSTGPSNASFARVLAAVSSVLSSDENSAHIIRSLACHQSFGVSLSGYSCLEKERKSRSPERTASRTKTTVLSLSLTLDAGGTTEREELWANVFSQLPLSNIVEANIFRNLYLTCDIMAKTLGKLPHLASLSLTDSFPGVAKMLRETQSDYNGDSSLALLPPKLAFPELRTLTLCQFSFDQVDDLPLDSLLQSLIWRYEFGAEIEKLDLQDCFRLDEDDVDLLREVVVDVFWDGVEQGYTDDEEDSDDYNDSYDENYYDDPYYSDDYFGYFW